MFRFAFLFLFFWVRIGWNRVLCFRFRFRNGFKFLKLFLWGSKVIYFSGEFSFVGDIVVCVRVYTYVFDENVVFLSYLFGF